MIGQNISHYKILEKLGEYGMSQTFPRSRLVGREEESLTPKDFGALKRSGSGRFYL